MEAEQPNLPQLDHKGILSYSAIASNVSEGRMGSNKTPMTS